MKNILLLCESYGGGVKTYIDSIFSNKEFFPNVEFTVLVSSKRTEIRTNINSEYLVNDNLSFGKSPFKLIKALVEIDKVVKNNDIHIIHANSTFSGFLIYLYSFYNRQISFIYTPHGYYSFKSMNQIKKKLIRFVEKKINQICNKVIHVSNSEENEAIKYQLVTLEKSMVIFNGVEAPFKVINIRNPKDTFTIVNLARLDDQKNPFEFIEIAKYVLEQEINVEFIWAGSGKYLEEVKEIVKKHNLECKIKFIGFSDKKHEILSKADLYLSTSFYEGLPFSVIEAMSYKLPLALSNIGGHIDLVNDEKNGLLFDHKDYRSVKVYIENIINNTSKWDDLSNSSYLYYKEHFSLEVMLESLAKVYEKCCNVEK